MLVRLLDIVISAAITVRIGNIDTGRVVGTCSCVSSRLVIACLSVIRSSGRLTSTGSESDPFPPILVNVGDLLNYWTNGLLKSTIHRVVFPDGNGEDRFSIAYFCHPVDDAPLVAIPSDLVASQATSDRNAGANGGLTAAAHLESRLAATYGWRTQADPACD